MNTQEPTTNAAGGASALTAGLERMVVLENANGVQIREDKKFHGHYGAANAVCECGEELASDSFKWRMEHQGLRIIGVICSI